MTIWDNIYKNYQKSGVVWASLSEEIHPLFINYLLQTNFDFRHVLDIGSGTGKYLKFLQASTFRTDGIDSSETAVKMTKALLGNDSIISYVNMFEFEIPSNKYDLIISISTIYHGTKGQVQNLINKIYEALIVSGKIFITVPDLENSKKWNTFKNHKEIANCTFTPLIGPEKGLLHSFYTKEEVH